MSKLLLTICALCFSASVSGQQIKARESGFEEFRALFERAGYEAFSFDLSELLGDRYNMVMSIKEYAAGKEVDSRRISLGSTKTMLTDFPEQSRAKVTREMMADPDAGVYSQAEKLTIGFYPSEIDTLAQMQVNMPSMGRIHRRLELHAIEQPDAKPLYWYNVRPFVIDAFEIGKFIPLVFYGSGWYDECANICRFCGEKEIAPDLSSEIVEKVPHFYVIGLEFTKK